MVSDTEARESGGKARMKSFEDRTHVFIVRVWSEPREIEGAAPVWRGVIQHVPSGDRRYFKELEDVCLYIKPYLEALQIKFGMHWRVRQWLQYQKRR